MTPLALELVHSVECGPETQGELLRPDVAEIVRRQGRKEQKADVCRRSAMGHQPARILLEVVGRQPVVFRPDELLEEQPRLAGKQPQLMHLRLGELRTRRTDRPADAGCY